MKTVMTMDREDILKACQQWARNQGFTASEAEMQVVDSVDHSRGGEPAVVTVTIEVEKQRTMPTSQFDR